MSSLAVVLMIYSGVWLSGYALGWARGQRGQRLTYPLIARLHMHKPEAPCPGTCPHILLDKSQEGRHRNRKD